MPDALRAHAGLAKGAEAVLVGTVTVFHIWESARHAAYVAATPDEAGFDPSVLQKYGL